MISRKALILAIVGSVGVAVIAAPAYKPAKMGAYYSSDGTGNAGTWLPMAGTGGVGTPVGRVQAAGLYYSSDGTGNDGTWLPCALNCFGGAGTINSGSQNQLAFYSAAGTGTVLSGTNALPNGTTATTQSPGDSTTKAANDAFVAAAIAAAAPTVSEFTNELGTPTLTGATNVTRLWAIWFPNNLSSAKITYRTASADNTANLYDIGFYNTSGSLVCHTGATAGTTFAPSAFADFTLSFISACNFTAGQRYLFAITGNASTAGLAGTTRRFMPVCAAAPATGNATSGGVLNSSVTFNPDSWADGCGEIFLGLHN